MITFSSLFVNAVLKNLKFFFWAVVLLILGVFLVFVFTLVGVFVGYVLPVILLVVLIKILIGHFKK